MMLHIHGYMRSGCRTQLCCNEPARFEEQTSQASKVLSWECTQSEVLEIARAEQIDNTTAESKEPSLASEAAAGMSGCS